MSYFSFFSLPLSLSKSSATRRRWLYGNLIWVVRCLRFFFFFQSNNLSIAHILRYAVCSLSFEHMCRLSVQIPTIQYVCVPIWIFTLLICVFFNSSFSNERSIFKQLIRFFINEFGVNPIAKNKKTRNKKKYKLVESKG